MNVPMPQLNALPLVPAAGDRDRLSFVRHLVADWTDAEHHIVLQRTTDPEVLRRRQPHRC